MVPIPTASDVPGLRSDAEAPQGGPLGGLLARASLAAPPSASGSYKSAPCRPPKKVPCGPITIQEKLIRTQNLRVKGPR
eukprot:2018865-Pyramimonas_sp.AAC.1